MFDTRGIDTSSANVEYKPLKAGTYAATVGECSWSESDSGAQCMVVNFEVNHHGRVHRVRNWIYHHGKKGQPLEVGQKIITSLARACNAVGSKGEPLPEAMAGNLVEATFKVAPDQKGIERNELVIVSAPAKRPGAHRYKRPDPTEVETADTGPDPDDDIPF